MRILSEHNDSTVVNDCYIYLLWQLVEIFDQLVILKYSRITGWFNRPLEVVSYTEQQMIDSNLHDTLNLLLSKQS